MTIARYEAQTARLSRIADSLFPNCCLFFGTGEKPEAVSLEITDSTNATRICLFPRPTSIATLEGMGDTDLKMRFEDCAKLWGHSI